MRITARCDPRAPSLIRNALAGLPADGWGYLLDDALIVVSELVANAVRHSCGRHDETLSVDLREDPDRLRISVLDPGSSGDDAETVDRAAGDGGFGLKVVEQLSTDWGAERGRRGYRVWAELERHPRTELSSAG